MSNDDGAKDPNKVASVSSNDEVDEDAYGALMRLWHELNPQDESPMIDGSGRPATRPPAGSAAWPAEVELGSIDDYRNDAINSLLQLRENISPADFTSALKIQALMREPLFAKIFQGTISQPEIQGVVLDLQYAAIPDLGHLSLEDLALISTRTRLKSPESRRLQAMRWLGRFVSEHDIVNDLYIALRRKESSETAYLQVISDLQKRLDHAYLCFKVIDPITFNRKQFQKMLLETISIRVGFLSLKADGIAKLLRFIFSKK